jgi:cell division protein FtsI/penicillin-binding protein 2
LAALTKRNILATVILVLCAGQRAAPACSATQDLHTQAASAVLAREFSDPDLSYLLLNENGQIIAQRWEHPERDVPVGSLVKPFLAAAYGQTHPTFPEFLCTGKKTCWLVRGHGKLQIRDAIAFSCNSYFHQLVAGAGPDFAQALKRYPVHIPVSGSAAGLASPVALAKAYLELTRHPRDAAVLPILEGLALSAERGTGKAAGAELPHSFALAKTGTAPCTHPKKAPGDGFALVMAPAGHPRAVLLVRLHGRPGFIAAGVAGRMIAAVEGSEMEK